MHLVQPIAWVVACASLAIVLVLLRIGVRRHALAHLGPANLVTLIRAVLVCAVAGLVAQSLIGGPDLTGAITALAGVALVLDAVDGWVARRLRSVTSLGARFDMETDAVLILVLSVEVARALGWWVLAIGLARYVLLGAQRLWPLLRGSVPPRYWRKVVAAGQGVALAIAVSGVLPDVVSTALLVVALLLLALSFGTEVRERLVGDASTVPFASMLSLLMVWVALAAPGTGSDPSPWLMARVPVELLVLTAAAVVLPRRWVGWLAVPFGFLAAVVLVLKMLNLGFGLVLDRRFHLLGDWTYLGSGIGVLGDSSGRPVALLVVVLIVGLVLALLVLVPFATLRVCQVARRHPRPAVGLLAALGAGSLLVGGYSVASAGLAVDEVRVVRADLRDRSLFEAQIEIDAYAKTPGSQLLQGLRGKDVLLIFVESYGRSAVADTSYSPGIRTALTAGTRRLDAAGYHSRSAFLTSPTFGAGSWLAHATTQSGLWVNSQRRYDQLLDASRLTLSGAFARAGWRTVFDVPAITRPWPEGGEFYGFDQLYDAGNVGYQGPAFGYDGTPDQYTLARFRTLELLPTQRPRVAAEIDLTSSHHPWTPLPHLVDWGTVGDGSVFDPMPSRGHSSSYVFADPSRVRQAYGESVRYSINTVVSFLTTYPDKDLVVVLLGDHEPHHYVSGADPGHDVPVTVIAGDPTVIDRIADWGWSPGLLPAAEAPVWRMDSLRDRFLSAFAGD